MDLHSTKALVAAAALAAAIAPAAHANDRHTGFTCGFVSSTDDTGLVFNDGRQHGEVDGGPEVIFNEAGGTISNVTTSCWIQINRADPCATLTVAACPELGQPVGVRESTVTGSVGLLVDTLDYAAALTDNVYLCTRFTWNSSKGGGSFTWDDDDLTTGVQCGLATSV
jgi:hypothetical protein